jgi:hypothetical protein
MLRAVALRPPRPLIHSGAVSYAEERLELIARLRSEQPGRSLPDSLRLDGRALRFHLGTSLADLRVPVHIADELHQALHAAVRDLFFLLTVRHRILLREAEQDRLILLDGFDPRGARPASYTAPVSVKSEFVRRAFLEAPELHPALDSGLMASWLTSARPGRVLAGALNAVLRRALEESQSHEPPEKTAYLTLLAFRALARDTLATVRDLPVSGPFGRALQGAVAAGMLIVTRLSAGEARVPDAATAAACGALPWLGGVRSLWGCGFAGYGVPFAEQPPRLETQLTKILAGATADQIARDAHAELNSSKDGARKAARQVGLQKLRAELLQLLRMLEIGRAPVFATDQFTMAQLYGAPGVLERILATPAARKDLHARAKAAARLASNDQARALLESVALAGKEWKDEDPGAYVSTEQVVRSWSGSVAALAVDWAMERALDQAEAQLVHRTGGENEGGIESDHEEGKLYLFSLDQPILRGRTRSQQMGHLFCDMKDFTKRTAFLKETVVADFLSREFYGPILTAAARHAHGAAHLADKGGIYLNNLLGDAVSFSGDIVSLLELSEEIRRALGSYARRLDTESSRESVSRTVSTIEEKYRVRQEQLTTWITSAKEAQRRGTLDPISGEESTYRLRALAVAQQKLDDERENEIALASGEKLEAGIFVSYGAAPEVATFEDHIFGPIKVSIAEKINESARGTARNGGVRARVDALLAAERQRRGQPGLVCPLQVAVSQPLSMQIPADIEIALRRSVAGGDLEGAETVLGGAVRDFVTRLASQEAYEDRGDIYNGGAAVSEEALKAWIDARGQDYLFLRRELPVTALNPALRDKFVFPMQTLRLVMSVSHSAQSLQDLFVFVGRALFKGFEKQGGLGIYELISHDSRFFTLLAEHHLKDFLSDDDQPGTGEWQPILLGGNG